MLNSYPVPKAILALSAALMLGGCASAKGTALRVLPTSAQLQGRSDSDSAKIDQQCIGGQPERAQDVNWGPMQLIARDGYVLEHSSQYKIALWVCEKITKAQLQGSLPRKDAFAPDPLLKPGQRAELADYKGSGYDRGHQAPAGDQSVNAQLKAETYYLSNMTPQVPRLNQQGWEALEEKVRGWAEEFGTVWVITGPMIWDDAEDNPSTADGFVEYYIIGKDKVAVPTHYYKIVVRKLANGELDALAFVTPNKPAPKSTDFTTWLKPIRWIEARTQLDFLNALDLDVQNRLESKAATALWN